MKDLKITVDQLKNYLGTGLIMEYSGYGEKKPLDKWSISVQENWDIHFMDEGQTDDDVLFYFKPICYRLSDLDKEIEHNRGRFVPFKRLLNDDPQKDSDIEIELINGKLPFQTRLRAIVWIDYPDGESRKEYLSDFFINGNQCMTPFMFMQKLFEWHFWPFGEEYFEKGLVIDKVKYK